MHGATLYTDGSCDDPRDPYSARGAWAVVLRNHPISPCFVLERILQLDTAKRVMNCRYFLYFTFCFCFILTYYIPYK